MSNPTTSGSSSRRPPRASPSPSIPPASVLAPLQRQTSLTDPAALVAGFPELERGLSASSAKSRQKYDLPLSGRRASDIQEEKDEKDLVAGAEDGDASGGAVGQVEEVTFPDGGLKAWLVVLGESSCLSRSSFCL